jgi:hypothetical protein
MFDLVDDTDTAPLTGGYQKGNRFLKNGLKKSTAALTEGKTEGLGYLDANTAKADTFAAQAADPYKDLYNDFAKPGMEGYWDLLTNPDSIYDSELYKSREAAGIDSINRGYNARGMLASGNNTQDQLDYMRRGGLDYFNTLLGGYAPYNQMGLAAAGGISGAYGNRADLWSQLGRDKSGVATGTAGQIANNTMNTFGQIGQNKIGLGENLTNVGMYDSAQDWNAIMGLGNLALGGVKAYMGA